LLLTKYLIVDAKKPDPAIIETAARFIRAGELVAFPTETVYGLGASAFQPEAVQKIFIAKGRPQEKPLLVHISNLEQVAELAAVIPEDAERLMKSFWPGPLSIILPARNEVPQIVRGDGIGVGIRMPSHPVALALIDAAGPLSAPSANLHGRPSPTTAAHVRDDLNNMIAAVLDAGETGTGLESTLIDMCSRPYSVLRLGGVGQSAIENCLGEKVSIIPDTAMSGYRTKVRVQLCADWHVLDDILTEKKDLKQRIGILTVDEDTPFRSKWTECIFKLDLSENNFNLYYLLREAEKAGIDVLLVAPFESDKIGKAAMERLQRATLSG